MQTSYGLSQPYHTSTLSLSIGSLFAPQGFAVVVASLFEASAIVNRTKVGIRTGRPLPFAIVLSGTLTQQLSQAPYR